MPVKPSCSIRRRGRASRAAARDGDEAHRRLGRHECLQHPRIGVHGRARALPARRCARSRVDRVAERVLREVRSRSARSASRRAIAAMAVDRRQEARTEIGRVRHDGTPNVSASAVTRHSSVTPRSCHARLRVVDGPGLEARRNPRRAVVPRPRGEPPLFAPPRARHVLGREHRLLQPAQAERRQPSRHLDRLDDRPRTVRVEHDPRAGTGDVARAFTSGTVISCSLMSR